MTVYSAVRNAIVAAVNTVTNVGLVHNRARYSSDWSSFFTFFKTTLAGTDEILGWWVTWGGIPETNVEGTTFEETADRYRFIVRGIMGLRDASDSESTFLSLASDVVDAVRSRKNFGQSEVEVFSVDVTTNEPDIRQFGSVLCHYLEIYVECVVAKEVNYT